MRIRVRHAGAQHLLAHTMIAFASLSIGVAGILFVAQVEPLGFGASGCVGLFSLFVVPGIGFACVAWGMAKHRPRAVVRGVSLILAAVAALAGSVMTSRAQEEASKQRGDELCHMLDSYQRATGGYPERLDALVPRFIPTLPGTCMGLFRDLPYHYWRQDDGLDYRLSFDSIAFIECRRSRSRGWRCDD